MIAHPLIIDGEVPSSVRRETVTALARHGRELAALRAPLAAKVIGAYLLVSAALCLVVAAAPLSATRIPIMVAAGVVGTAAYVALILTALRPIKELEGAATRVWQGDYADISVDPSGVADHEVLRVGAMFNLLLDSVSDDRERMRRLAADVIQIGDLERARLAHELHDSTAQRLAAVLLHLGAVARDANDPLLQNQLHALRDEVHAVLEEVRAISYRVHPRVLDDLGLSAALRKLGREVGEAANIMIEVRVPRAFDVSPAAAAVLYRVAEEALRNVVRHAQALHAIVEATVDRSGIVLRVRDDGRGFDPTIIVRRPSGMCIFTMRERLELIGGVFSISSTPGDGTTVGATVPMDGPERSGFTGRERARP